MATLLEDAGILIISIENGIKNMKSMYNSKQSERWISNHVWVIDQVEEKIKKHIPPLKDLFVKLKQNHLGDFKSSTNFDICIKHCNDVEKILNDITVLYKMRVNNQDLKMKWQYALPQLQDNLDHLTNRFNIIKGQISRKGFEYEESWF